MESSGKEDSKKRESQRPFTFGFDQRGHTILSDFTHAEKEFTMGGVLNEAFKEWLVKNEKLVLKSIYNPTTKKMLKEILNEQRRIEKSKERRSECA